MCSCLTASACRLRMPLDAGRDPQPPKACCMTGEAAGTCQILGVAQVGHPEASTLAPARSGKALLARPLSSQAAQSVPLLRVRFSRCEVVICPVSGVVQSWKSEGLSFGGTLVPPASQTGIQGYILLHPTQDPLPLYGACKIAPACLLTLHEHLQL